MQLCAHIHSVRSKFIQSELVKLGIRCTEPMGAFYITANFDPWADALARIGVSNSQQLAEYLLTEFSIASLSADSFGVPEKELSLRLSTSYLDFESESDSRRLIDLYTSGISDQEFMSAEHHPNTHAALRAFAECVDRL